MPRDKRTKKDLHALDEHGMVMCNPRDKEASLKAQTKGIATEEWGIVTCRKCLMRIYEYKKSIKEKQD